MLSGDSGADIFVLRTSTAVNQIQQADFIVDFQIGVDRIGLTGGLTAQNLLVQNVAGNTVIRINPSGQILGIVANTPPTAFSVNDFVPVNIGVV